MRPRLLNGLVACALILLLLSHLSWPGVLVVALIASAFLRLPALTLGCLAALILLAAFSQPGTLALLVTLCACIVGVWLLSRKST